MPHPQLTAWTLARPSGAPAAGVLAARGGAAPGAFAAATRALPRDIAAFTGRQAELAHLVGALAAAAAAGGGWWAYTRSMGWPEWARPRLRCTRRSG